MNDHLRKHYIKLLDRIEMLERQITMKRGYTKDSRNLRMLAELVKEQVPNANTRNSTR